VTTERSSCVEADRARGEGELFWASLYIIGLGESQLPSQVRHTDHYDPSAWLTFSDNKEGYLTQMQMRFRAQGTQRSLARGATPCLQLLETQLILSRAVQEQSRGGGGSFEILPRDYRGLGGSKEHGSGASLAERADSATRQKVRSGKRGGLGSSIYTLKSGSALGGPEA